MPRKLLYFLLFSNACVLALYVLRWWSNYHFATDDLSSMNESTISLLWEAMPKALVFFIMALLYLLAELVTAIRTPNHSDILDIPSASNIYDQ